MPSEGCLKSLFFCFFWSFGVWFFGFVKKCLVQIFQDVLSSCLSALDSSRHKWDAMEKTCRFLTSTATAASSSYITPRIKNWLFKASYAKVLGQGSDNTDTTE